MQIKSTDGSSERMILIGMIVDPIVCGQIADKWEKRLFRSKWANLISLWCTTYYKKYNKAPRKQIEGLYKSWERKSHDKETVKIVNKFLSGLSDEYAELKRDTNPKYILDRAGEYFSEVRLERLREDIESALTSNDISKALTRVSDFNEVQMGDSETINVFQDLKAWDEIFTDEAPSLIKYPGPLGKFFGNQLARDSFVAFAAPEKRGKSHVLMDMAYRAVLQRRKVAFFEAGDMSPAQLKKRLAVRACARPFYKETIKYPTAIRKLKDQKVSVDCEPRTFTKNMSKAEIRKRSRKIYKSRIRSKDSYFKLRFYANSMLHTAHIEEKLREWAREGWMADVVVIDYADILDMSYSHIEGRDRIDKTWRELRKISQIFHCLVVTATQTNRLSYDADTITRKHSSEDKRKLAHVTAMYGINQTTEEKIQGVMRFNCMELRDGAYAEGTCVFMAGCLSVGNIAIRSTM